MACKCGRIAVEAGRIGGRALAPTPAIAALKGILRPENNSGKSRLLWLPPIMQEVLDLLNM